MTTDTTPVLHHIRFSHFNEKARWTLDYKGIPHRRHAVMPGPHPRTSKRLGGRGTMPVLEPDDGPPVADSTEIIAWAERRKPDPPLYPAEGADRERALELEEYFDVELGPPIRSAVFHALLADRSATVRTTMQGYGAGRKAFMTVMYPAIRRAVTRDLDAGDDNLDAARAKTVAAMDRLESELGGGDYLVGGRFSNADLTAAALFFPLVSPGEYQYEWPDPWPPEWREFQGTLSERPGYAWVAEMFRRHRGDSAEVA